MAERGDEGDLTEGEYLLMPNIVYYTFSERSDLYESEKAVLWKF